MTDRGSRHGWVFPGACLLALAVLLGAYSNSLQNAFQFDDSYVVEGNLYIRSLKNIPLFFRDARTLTVSPWNAQYRQLVSTTLALDYWLGGGLSVRTFHLSQLAMLVLLGVAVFFMFLRVMHMAGAHWWNRWAALVAAAFYSVHTTNSETLNLMYVRSEILSTLGVVGSFLVYFYLPRSRRAHLYLLPAIVGAFAKTPAVMFAPLFLVYLALFEQGLSAPDLFTSRSWPAVRTALWKALPAFVVGAALFMFVEGMADPRSASDVDITGGRLEYLWTQPFMWLHYGRLFVVPAGLSVDSDWTAFPHWYDTRVIAGLVFIAFLLRVLWSSSRLPASRPVAFGIAWFGLGLLPASSIFPLAEVTNDHRAFFSYVGLSLAVVWGLGLLIERWCEVAPRLRPLIARGAVALALVAVSGNAVGTYERNKVFLTGESFWRDVVEKSPGSGRGLMNYGLTQMSLGRYAEAKRFFDRAAVYLPNYARLDINLGVVTDLLGEREAAEAHFTRALQVGPNDPLAHSFYARWLVAQGRSGEAIPHLQRAIALSPSEMDARHQLMAEYAKAGRDADAKALASETLALAPGDSLAARFLNGRGDIAVSPPTAPRIETAEDFLNTSLRLYQAGDFQGSIGAARKALEIRPDYAEAHNNVAAGLASLGRWDEAIAAAREALRLRPDFPLARNNLAWAEREKAAKGY
jgi:Flp pilus assembly protein TadD